MPTASERETDSPVRPLANVITLGTVDFDRMRRFYGLLGWPVAFEDETFVVFELRGAVLALFPVERLASDGRVRPGAPDPRLRFTLGLLAESRADVDLIVDRMRAAGGDVTKPPTDAEFFEGRSAYVADPEGNYWEVAWAPPDNPVVAAATRAAACPL